MVLTFALGSYQALALTPWGSVDEWAHTGYVMSLTDGHLPTLSTPIEMPSGSSDEAALVTAAMRQRWESRGEDLRNTVWVANHPPGPYVLIVPGALLADRFDQGNLVILLQRLSNVLGATLAVGFVALLGRRLSGRPEVGVLAAGVLAVNQYLGTMSSRGMTDGMGFAALTGLVWAATLACERRFDRRSTTILATFAVACGLMRLTALLAAGAVVLVALLVHAVRTRSVPWRPALGIALPVVVLCSWFYLLTWHRYGDPGASDVLLDRFGFTPKGSLSSSLFDRAMWEKITRAILSGRGDPTILGQYRTPATTSLLAVAAVAGSALLLAGRALVRRSRVEEPSPPTSDPTTRRGEAAGWLLLAAAIAANALTTAQHVSGGGNMFARYAIMILPAAACLVASATVVIVDWMARWPSLRRAAPVVAVVPFVATAIANVTGLSDAVVGAPGLADLGPAWSLQLAGIGIAAGSTAYVVCWLFTCRPRLPASTPVTGAIEADVTAGRQPIRAPLASGRTIRSANGPDTSSLHLP